MTHILHYCPIFLPRITQEESFIQAEEGTLIYLGAHTHISIYLYYIHMHFALWPFHIPKNLSKLMISKFHFQSPLL